MSRNLEQGVQAIQNGNPEEGARLLRIALKDDELLPNLRAVALLWLAETSPEASFKIDCYRQANEADPGNQDVSQRLSYWLARELPEQNLDSERIVPITPQEYDQIPDTGQNPSVNPQQYGLTSEPGQNLSIAPQHYGQIPDTGQIPTFNAHQYGNDTTGSIGPVDPRSNVPSAAQGRYGVDPPIFLEQVQRSVGILDGPNGRGTGIFIARDGLIATTRYVIGGEEQLQIELMDGRVIPGQVVRAFPELDIALIQVNVQLNRLTSFLKSELPDNARITAITHTGKGLGSAKRATRHQTAPHWFPTMINRLHDAGGDPVFNEQNLLVGIMTKNASRSNAYMYGIYIQKIDQCAYLYSQEKQQLVGNTAYCVACGVISRAPSFKGYYCENCGYTLPSAVEQERFPQPDLAVLYGENAHRACPNCSAQVGFYKGSCLRCGHEL